MVLEVKNLSLERGTRLLQQGLSLELGSGVALWLRGPNGVGKSTLLETLCGFRRPGMGEVLWQDRSIWDELDSFHEAMSYIGHKNANNETLLTQDALKYYAKIYNSNNLEEALHLFGLENRKDVQVRFLSAGQKKRLALARLALRETPLWILDEPAVSLDQDGVVLLTNAMQEQIKRGGSIIFTSHTKLDLKADELNLRKLSKPKAQQENEFLSEAWETVI